MIEFMNGNERSCNMQSIITVGFPEWITFYESNHTFNWRMTFKITNLKLYFTQFITKSEYDEKLEVHSIRNKGF